MYHAEKDHDCSGRCKGEGGGQDAPPVKLLQDRGRGVLQTYQPERSVAAGDADGMAAERVSRTGGRRQRRKVEHECRRADGRKHERRMGNECQASEDGDGQKAVDEHERRPYQARRELAEPTRKAEPLHQPMCNFTLEHRRLTLQTRANRHPWPSNWPNSSGAPIRSSRVSPSVSRVWLR